MLNNQHYKSTAPTKKWQIHTALLPTTADLFYAIGTWVMRQDERTIPTYTYKDMILCVYASALPGMEPRALRMPGNCSSTECSPGRGWNLKKSRAGDLFF